MDQTLNQIADQIIIEINEGLKGSTDFSISRELIKDDFSLGRSRHIQENYKKLDRDSFAQSILKLNFVSQDFSEVLGYDSGRKELGATIPELVQIQGFNPVIVATEMSRNTLIDKIIFGRDFLHTKNDRYTSAWPTLLIQDKKIWLLNPPTPNTKSLFFRAIFENPRALNKVDGVSFIDDDPYPMPGAQIDIVRNKIVETYIRRFRLGSMKPTMTGDLNIQN